MQFSRAVLQSARDLRAHPRIVLPEVLSLSILFLGLLLFLRASGLYAALRLFASWHAETGGAVRFAESKVYPHIAQAVLRWEVFWLALGMLLLVLLVQAFFACWSFGLVTLLRTGRAPRLLQGLRVSLRVFPRFILIRVILLLLVYAPFVAVLVGFFLWVIWVSSWLAFLLFPVLVFLLLMGIPYMMFILTRFLFAAPLLFLRETRVLPTLQGTFRLTGKAFWYAFVVFLIAGVFAAVYQFGGTRPLWLLFSRLLVNPEPSTIVFVVLLAVPFLFVAAVALTMEQLYVFNSYEDYVSMVERRS